MMQLYPHQGEIVAAVENQLILPGTQRVMVALATGAGKTVIASHLIHRSAGRGHQTLFIVHMKELVNQAVRHLEAMGLQVGILQAENTRRRPTDEVTVATIQTIGRRNAPLCDSIIIDEAHVLHKRHIELIERWDLIPVVGLSATPLRPDLGKYFNHLERGPGIKWLTENDYLVPAKAFCPTNDKLQRALAGVHVARGDFKETELADALNTKTLVGDVVSTWMDKASDRRTLCFAVNIAHSKSLADAFRVEGIEVAHIDFMTPDEERQEIFAAFRAGDIRILTSVNVLGIGFDVPDAACAILARPTLSWALHLQQCGRVIRTAPGKADAMLLDHAGNIIRHGMPAHFECPDLGEGDHRTTSDKRKDMKMHACHECGYALEPGQITCPNCGIDRPTRRSDISYVPGELVALGDDAPREGNYPLHDQRDVYLQLKWLVLNRTRTGNVNQTYYYFQDYFGERYSCPYSWRDLPARKPTPAVARWFENEQLRRRIAWRNRRVA